MADFLENLNNDLKVALKEKNRSALNAIRALKTALTNFAIEKGGLGTSLENSEIMAIVKKQVKQRQDSIESFAKAGRDDLIATEKSELEILSKYLPKQMSAGEIAELVKNTIAELGVNSKKEMGKVMKALQEKTQGSADNKLLSQEVMKLLK